jgi:predicted nucleic acid-binding protein
LLVAECANALWKKVRRNELTAQEASLAARLLQRADIELEPMRDLIEPATQLAITLDHPAYDCLYLALAQANEAEFVTADEALSRKVRVAGLKIRTTALSAYRSG